MRRLRGHRPGTSQSAPRTARVGSRATGRDGPKGRPAGRSDVVRDGGGAGPVALSGVVGVVVIALCAWGLGHRRLGYRVQMDCDLSERFPADHTGVLRELGEDGRTLHQPSMVLVRIENAGSTGIR